MIDETVPFMCQPVTAAQPAGPRLFIFGCARSGTTLLLHLFRTFDGTTVWDEDHCLSTLIEHPSQGWVVAKRTPRCADHLIADVPRFRPVWIVNILRDPRDVVTSRLQLRPHAPQGYYCDFSRWQRDVEVGQAIQGLHLRLLQLRYERLVAEPDAVQQDLAAILDLSASARFSDFPRTLPGDLSPFTLNWLGRPRPLDARGVGRWRGQAEDRHRVAGQLATYPQMESLLRHHGYAATDPVD